MACAIFISVFGLAAVAYGIRAMITSEFKLSTRKTLTGSDARLAGMVSILGGILISPVFYMLMLLLLELLK